MAFDENFYTKDLCRYHYDHLKNISIRSPPFSCDTVWGKMHTLFIIYILPLIYNYWSDSKDRHKRYFISLKKWHPILFKLILLKFIHYNKIKKIKWKCIKIRLFKLIQLLTYHYKEINKVQCSTTQALYIAFI